MTKILPDGVLDSLYTLRIRQSDQLKTVLELYDLEIHLKISMLNYQMLKTMVIRNFDARNEKIETEAVVTNRRVIVMLKEDQEDATNEKQKDSVREEIVVVSGTMRVSVQKPTPKTAPPTEPPTQRGRSASRKKNLRGRSPTGKFARQPCKDNLKGICTKSPCDYWHPPEYQFYKSETGCKFGDKCSFAQRQVEFQPSKKPKKDGD